MKKENASTLKRRQPLYLPGDQSLLMPTVQRKPVFHLICGLPGSGKTTLAKQIAETTGAIRFCPDDWIKMIWRENAESSGNQYRDQVEQMQWQMAVQLLNHSIDVIIEWGTWGRSEREKLRDDAKAAGATVSFYFLNPPQKILRERLLKRNLQADPNEFSIPAGDIDAFLTGCFNSLQVPTQDELLTYDCVG